MSSFKLRKEKDCLNCGRIVEENFCTHCGQENIELKENAVHMVSHAIADYFHFEHKFFGTIKPLLLKPGKLTTAYVTGKRVSYIHPIRLYIFISIVFFLIILSGNHDKVNVKEPGEKAKKEKKKKDDNEIPANLSPAQKDSVVAARLEDFKEALKYIPLNKAEKDSILKVAETDIRNGKRTQTVNGGWNVGRDKKFGGSWSTTDTTVEAYENKQAALPKAQRDGFLKHYYIKRSIELNKYPDPKQKFIEDFLHNIPKMMFLLLPMFALILKLVYINKKKYYYEHLIYSFHLHSAIFLSILITLLLQWFFKLFYDISGWLSFLCVLYICWYIYRSLRSFYGSTRWITILKIGFLFFAYNIVLTISFLIILAVSFAMV
ncbi:hypothetical protein D9M68_636400 [compost metagenome]